MDKAMIRTLVGSATTTPRDTSRHAALLRAFRGQPEYSALRSAIIAARAEWQVWVTVTQRKWQKETRRTSRARHHDSVSIRERYVRGQS